jgi:hypothetical protein
LPAGHIALGPYPQGLPFVVASTYHGFAYCAWCN